MRYKKKILTLLLPILLLLSAGAAPAFAATYYVSTTGSDSAAGSQTAPWKTIAYAVSRMNAGDTTYVRGGTYNEGMIWFRKSGTASAPIKLINAPGESPKINFTGSGFLGILIAAGSGAGYLGPIGWIHVEGFEITNGIVGFRISNAHDLVIRRNWIHHAHSQGILGNGRNVLVDRNVINRVGDFEGCAAGKLHMPGSGGIGTVCNKDHAIYGTGPNWMVTNNLIYDNLAFGVHVAGYPVFYGTKRMALDESYAGADNWLIANNTIAYQNQRSGIIFWQGGAKNGKVINNILYENTQVAGSEQGVSFLNDGGGHVIQNNLCYATAPGATKCIEDQPGKYTASGNIVNTVNPNFVSAGPTISGVPNFHLNAGSPAIDAGLSLPQVTWDHDGGARPWPTGGKYDIGAYEHGSPPDSGSPPPNPTGGGTGGTNCPPGGGSADPPPATGSVTPPPTGAGNTYWVATNGSDSAAGSQTAPWKTIAYAVSRMNAGDTTYVRGGTYNEKLIVFTKSGAPGAPIRLLNAPGETPKIEFGLVGGTSSQPVYRMELNAPGATPTPIGWITIEGFEISHAYDGLKFYDAHDVVFRRNWVHHSINQGILGNGTRMLFDRNVIQHNGNFERCAAGALTSIGTSVCNQAHGMYITGTNYVITNNLIYDSSATGIQVAGYVHCPQGGCWGGSVGAPAKVYAGPEYGGASGWLIANNVIAYNNYGPGIQLWQFSAKNNTIINNIFYENGQKKSRGLTQGIVLTINTGGGHVIQNNLCYATAPGATSCISPGMQSKYTGSGNITVNPGFVNAPATLSGWPGTGVTPSGLPDFHLQASSPAIDAGQNLAPNVITDHEGGPRPWPAGGQYDIGAYEYGSPPDPNAPAPTPNWTSGTGGAGTGCVACSGEGDFLISLIPPGFTLSAGVVFSSTAFGDVYKLTRDELKDLTITPPAGFKGELSLVVSFLPADDTCMVTQDTMELSWGCEPPPPPPPPPGPYPCEPTIDNTNPPPGAAPWDATIRSKWVPVLLCMTHQYSVSMMHQMLAIGAMIDAKEQMETQRLAQQMAAEAYKDYQPSTQMCSIGTGVRSLAASEKLSENNAKGINRALMQRLTMSSSVSSAGGPDDDKRNRLDQFARKYCDLNDNNGALGPICGAASAPPARRNRDIDFTRTLENAYTLDFDMATLAGTGNTPATAATDDEEDILALANNLYSHDTFSHIGEDHVGKSYANDKVMETRSVDAMRSVALNSFAHIVGMRAQGAGESMPFLKNVLVEMGLSAAEADEMMGVKLAGTPPAAAPLKMSYFAQMEILTKKMFQTPEFFSNLYDTPENVARAGVALQAFALMNDRDRYESALRREMLISLILELKLREAQTTVNDSILRDSSDLFPKR